MKRKILLLGFLTIGFIQQIVAQANYVNMEYVSIPGIGCHTKMLACVNFGAQPESGAVVKIDWSDGYIDSMIVYGAPNSQTCYAFNHDYSQPGNYLAVTTVKSGTQNNEIVASQSFDCVVPTTTECGFFNVISLLNPSATNLNNVPLDVTGASGVTTTIYPVNSFGNPYYTQLNESDVPFTISVNDAWLQNNGYIQTTPDFTISSFDASGRAENLPLNVQLECAGNGQTPNLEISTATAFQFVAPLQTGNVMIQVCNISCGNFANSTIKIAIPQGVTPNLTGLQNAIFDSDTVTFSIPYLGGCTTVSFPCTFAGNTPAGTLFNFSASVQAENETDLLFNNQDFVATVLNSYDPNDKQCNLPEYIQPSIKEKLVYTIRFQNDGNFPALNVVVKDTISSLLDLNTFRLVSSKHPISYSIDPNTRIATFRFNGINLLPSDENLEGSQGTFTYSIEELDNLLLNSEIKNTAYIYFDFNPAIITNTTINKNANLGVSGNQTSEFQIYPNPSNGQITIDVPFAGNIKIIDIMGKEIFNKNIVVGQKVDFTYQSKGLYFICYKSTFGEVSKKLTIE